MPLFQCLNNGFKRRLWQVVVIKQKRFAVCTPGDAVVHAPHRDHLHRFVLRERPEQIGILCGEALIGLVDESALGGIRTIRNVCAACALSALRAVNIQLRYVDGQSQRFELRKRLVFVFKTGP